MRNGASHQDLEAVQKKIRSHMAEITRLFDSVQDSVSDGAQRLAEKTHSLVEDGQAAIEDGARKAGKLVKKHPLESLLVAFGIGCVVGLVINSKR